MAAQLIFAFSTIVVGVVGCVAYFWGANWLLDPSSPRTASPARRRSTICSRQGLIRPWLFIGPALIILTVYLIYPVVATIWLSFHDKSGNNFVGWRQLRLGTSAIASSGSRSSTISCGWPSCLPPAPSSAW